jgi:phosphoribosylamine--glycine ligase
MMRNPRPRIPLRWKEILIECRAMRILVIGSGGREHALVWKLAQSSGVTRLWCAPGNAGVAQERLRSGEPAQAVNIGAERLAELLTFAQDQRVELTLVGPDNPLALGIVDLFQEKGQRIWGPNRKAAQFESSKVFSQAFMERHGIPTARAGVFSEPEPARSFVASLGGRCAVKADGLALGKGVLICHDLAEAESAIEEVLVRKNFGSAGQQVVIQELLEGIEVSVHALCDGKTAKLFPTAQDHKRALDGDQGLNTGGMGTYSPAPFLGEADWGRVQGEIMDRWLRGCEAEGIDFRGILYPGIMLTNSGPKVLEFNARFGDPETQVYLPRLENDLLEVLEASAAGKLESTQLKWSKDAAVCVVMASGGYPGSYKKGVPIYGLEEADRLPNTKVFHAGTAKSGDGIVTNGGRVLGVTAWGDSLWLARERAYAAVELLRFENAHFRRDIGDRALAFEERPPAESGG